MAPSPSSSGTTTSVQVALRIRPPTNQDSTSIPARFQRTVINATSPTSVAIDATASTLSSVSSSTAAAASTSSGTSGKKQSFTFDQVHPPSTTQHAIFSSTALPLISRFVEGFNCTVLAYGQTSSGKTFTMTGIDLDADPSDSSNGMGIIPRSISHIFAKCRELKEERGNAWNFSIKGSFIEIYNEDLNDLLSMDDSGKTNVQIREDKQGHIIWEGLREVNVRSSTEVMNLIRQGTSIRRTNETDMNAQSSRSHAIFSLTLTQKKFIGSGPPPRSSSPLPPGGGRSPSRLARPSSTMHSSRVSSPTFGRPGTPSFTSAISRGGRPASSLGLLAPESRRQSLAPGGNQANGDSEGEWVTVVSKFHFVDLAGSERLKRTAAAGERIKEGISINSGLLALGNVISALGDPSRAKSNTASYIPYRDSKLTRLLQDSLGGNAHTLMIACVSPAEWNANETVNTLKYANRARNIKNRVVMNEKEEGWEDMEWLQNTITRLRKELKSLKEGSATLSANGESREVSDGATKKALVQMAELRHNYEEIRAKYVERTEELTRLRRELAEKQRFSGGAVGGTAKYEEIVGPVIEEYEKTISAIEAELSLNRAALRHTNDLVDEKEAELAQLSDRHAITEMYVEELKSRIAKLAERESSTEAYIHDLEDKMKLFDETSISSSGSITELRRELTKIKDTESHSAQYISDLETRLTKSDESVLVLQQKVATLEAECEKRIQEVASLKSRLELLQMDAQGWRTDLEAREDQIFRLEARLKEREAALREAGETRERLSVMVRDVSVARQDAESISIRSGISSLDQENTMETQLLELQRTHAATLADLADVSNKYQEAIRDIADLQSQLQEAKVNASLPPSRLSESPERPTEVTSPRRRMTRGMSKDGIDVQINGSGRRLMYRQAASVESLHSRSVSQSLSLSQELSSARSRKASTSSHGTSSSLSLSPTSRPALSLNINPNERSVQSLEAEIKRLQDVLVDRENEIRLLEDTLRNQAVKPATSEKTLAGTSPATPVNAESSPALHLSPKTMNQFQELRHSLGHSENGSSADAEGSLDRLNELMRSMAQKESVHQETVDRLNGELSLVKRQHEELKALSSNQALNMSAEMQGLRNQYEDSLKRLEEIQLREEQLAHALNKAQAEHSAVMESLKAAHEDAMKVKEAEIDALLTRVKSEHEFALSDLRVQLSTASASLAQAQKEHEEAFGKLRAEHEEELRRRSQEVEDTLKLLQEDHIAELAASLAKAEQLHQEARDKLQAEHGAEFKRREQEYEATTEDARLKHEDTLAKALTEHQATLKLKGEEVTLALQRTEEEYYNALTKLRTDHAQVLEKQASEAATTLERLKDEHVRELRMTEIAREGSLSESQSARDLAIKELQDAHAAAIANKEALFSADLQKLKEEYAALLAAKDEQHRASIQRLKADYASALHDKEAAFDDEIDKLRAEHTRALAAEEVQHQASLEKLALDHSVQLKAFEEDYEARIYRLSADLETSQKKTTSTAATVRKEMEDALQEVKQQQATILQEVERGHEEEITKLLSSHRQALADMESRSKGDVEKLHVEEVARLKAEHQTAVAALEADLLAAQEEHRKVLEEEDAHTQAAKTWEEEKAVLKSSLSDLEAKQAEELATSRRDCEHLSADKAQLAATIDTLKATHSKELLALQGEREALVHEKTRLSADLESRHATEKAVLQQEHLQELQAYKNELQSFKDRLADMTNAREQAQQKRDISVREQRQTVDRLEGELSGAVSERNALQDEISKLRAELEITRSKTSQLIEEAAQRESLAQELDKHKSALAETQNSLRKTRDEMETLQAEKSRQDALLRDLQVQIPASPSPRSASRMNGIPAAKVPPITPLPSVPKSLHDSQMSTASSTTISGRSIDSMESASTPATSVPPMSPTNSTADVKLVAQVQEQTKQIEEQEAMIKTLNKQLTHCERDLQAHMDMVSTLESSLAESEKNLRKARMQATEIARERDSLNAQVAGMRTELHEAKNEVVSVRRSVVEEKQSLEHRLDEERRAKERARAQLDSRVEEIQRRKSKFACL